MSDKRKDNKGRILLKGETQTMMSGKLRYRYFYKDADGKRKGIYADDLGELRVKEEQIRADLKDGIRSHIAENRTLNQQFDIYMEMSSLKKSSLSNYRYTYDKHVRHSLGNRKLSAVRYSDIYNLYSKLLQDGVLVYSSLNGVDCILHNLFNLAIRDSIIRTNPTSGALKEVGKKYKNPQPKRTALSPDEQTELIKFVKEHERYNFYYPLLVFLLGTGCRIGEVSALTWDDIDYSQNIIYINKSMTYTRNGKGKFEYHVTTPKTSMSIRVVPLLSGVKKALMIQKQQQFHLGGCKTNIDGYDNFVFTTQTGNAWTISGVNTMIKKMIDEHNENYPNNFINRYSAHNFRHTFATNLFASGGDVKTVQEILGHSNASTTLNIYIESSLERKMKAFQNLEGMISIG